MDKKTILLVDDYRISLYLIKFTLEDGLKKDHRLEFLLAGSVQEAAERMRTAGAENVSLVISDGFLSNGKTAIEVYDECRGLGYQGRFILHTYNEEAFSHFAAGKGHSPLDMFFAQVSKTETKEVLIEAARKALAA